MNLLSPKVPKAPSADISQPIADTEDDKKKAKKVRSRLFATEGGAAGEELAPGQVRGGFFGNS